MTEMKRLQQLAEIANARELTEEEKEEVREGLRPYALTIAEAFKIMGEVAEKFAAGLKVVSESMTTYAKRVRAAAMLCQCPNKRVVHLAKYGRKWRTRKKNLHRAARIVKKEEAKRC